MNRVYSYGALPPTDGAERAEDVLRAAHRYRNRLVEIERQRRGRYREIERSVMPDAIHDRVAAAESADEAAAQAIRDARAGVGRAADVTALVAAKATAAKELRAARQAYRTAAAPIREAAALLRVARGDEKTARRAAGKRDRDDQGIATGIAGMGAQAADLALRLHRNDSQAAAEQRAARAASGLAWGTYNLVEESVRQAAAKVPGDPHCPRFERYTGEGRIGAPQLVGGISPESLATERRFRLEILPLPEGASRRMTARRHAVASIRVGTDQWIRWPMLMHRPFPEGATVKQAWALRTRVGSTWRWQIQITIGIPDPVPAATPARTAAVEIGWRASEAWRVGYVVGDGGECEAIRAPMVRFGDAHRRRRAWARQGREVAPIAPGVERGEVPIAEALDYLDGIRSVRDRHFDAARGFLRGWLAAAPAPLPGWLVEVTQHIHAWRAAGRLVRVLRAWERAAERVAGDEAIVAGLRAWAAKDRHLWDWEAHGRARVLAARRDHYRVTAARLARTYGRILITDMDLSEFARGPEPEEGVPSDGRPLRKTQRACAPSTLRDAILHAARMQGCTVEEVDPAYDTVTCHACGHRDDWNNPAALHHTCSRCGSRWDRDQNAGVNRLRRGGIDAARALRLCA